MFLSFLFSNESLADREVMHSMCHFRGQLQYKEFICLLNMGNVVHLKVSGNVLAG